MADILRGLQTFLLTAASSMSLRRDAAIMVLALLVIGCLMAYAELAGP